MKLLNLFKTFLVIVGVILLVFFLYSFWKSKLLEKLEPTLVFEPTSNVSEEKKDFEVLAKNLKIPWEVELLPSGDLLLTERVGNLLLLKKSSIRDFEIEEVAHFGEGGLLGLALHPDFARNSFIYLYYTYKEGRTTFNKVVRYKFKDERLVEDLIILDRIPGNRFHDGGRIKFGPDGKLYITTGDSQNTSLAQETSSLAGKILRVEGDGLIPIDNPFDNNPVYSYGHRNPQGLAWDASGQLWATEHGPSGNDEVNKIEKGKNYGWPTTKGDEEQEGLEKPFIHSREDTWAPSGATIKGEFMYFSGLAGRAIYKLNLISGNLDTLLEGEFGRLRGISLTPDGDFHIITSNQDGRNVSPDASDDRLIEVSESFINGVSKIE